MSLAHQPSMWDLAEQATLGPLAVTRRSLIHGAWVDHLPGWVQGSDEVLDVLLGDIGWRADRRQMYEREVAVPRLLRWYGGDGPRAHPLVTPGRGGPNTPHAAATGAPLHRAGTGLYHHRPAGLALHARRACPLG